MEIPALVVDVAMGLLSSNHNTFNPENDIPSLDGKVIMVTGGMVVSIHIQSFLSNATIKETMGLAKRPYCDSLNIIHQLSFCVQET
jgi:hypothetical protein